MALLTCYTEKLNGVLVCVLYNAGREGRIQTHQSIWKMTLKHVTRPGVRPGGHHVNSKGCVDGGKGCLGEFPGLERNSTDVGWVDWLSFRELSPHA